MSSNRESCWTGKNIPDLDLEPLLLLTGTLKNLNFRDVIIKQMHDTNNNS